MQAGQVGITPLARFPWRDSIEVGQVRCEGDVRWERGFPCTWPCWLLSLPTRLLVETVFESSLNEAIAASEPIGTQEVSHKNHERKPDSGYLGGQQPFNAATWNGLA